MQVVLCYDVVEDARRRRLCAGLRGYLDHVQKSVFEGPLAPTQYDEVIQLVNRTIDHKTDNVRMYYLCRGCVHLTTHIGVARIIPAEPEDVVL